MQWKVFVLLVLTLGLSGQVAAADSYQMEFILHYDGKQEQYQYRNRFDHPYSSFSGKELSYVKNVETSVTSGTVVTNLTSGKVDDGFRVSFTLKNPAFNLRQLAELEYQFSRTLLISLKEQSGGVQVPETRVMQGKGLINIKAGESTLIHEDAGAGFRVEARFIPQE
ncbi:hypothetical protein MIB92_08850 [Aestuariirhabdus sp. Z084]|uniref:hypothetical protein n=1 Tax=Aestuariirhabdus haliotis TaxID=2918751 RepID=UPI00201B41B1|nr:hypothetical protein [Aestuariirhabdus haliotis]MCL6415758.1 hypothetical protein [Aestuariirhabdus haliotis]MCL6419675.1 hypothetical protein [Aestuariirhabdus haliotis]